VVAGAGVGATGAAAWWHAKALMAALTALLRRT